MDRTEIILSSRKLALELAVQQEIINTSYRGTTTIDKAKEYEEYLLEGLFEETEKTQINNQFDITKERLCKTELSVRSLNCLHGSGIDTVEDLLSVKRETLLWLHNFGKQTLRELDEFLERRNLKWEMLGMESVLSRIERLDLRKNVLKKY